MITFRTAAVGAALLVSAAASAQSPIAPRDTIPRGWSNTAVSLNVLGIFFGNYDVTFEAGVSRSAGVSFYFGYASNVEIIGHRYTGISSGMTALWYPARNALNGIALGATAAVVAASDTLGVTVAAAEYGAVLGYKLVTTKSHTVFEPRLLAGRRTVLFGRGESEWIVRPQISIGYAFW